MKKPKLDAKKLQVYLDKFAKNYIPLQDLISYCAMHQTNPEHKEYREKAVLSSNRIETALKTYNLVFPMLAKQGYPLIKQAIFDGKDMPELEGIEKFAAGFIQGVLDDLKAPIDIKGLQDWRDYCVSCKKTCPQCAEKGKSLASLGKDLEKKIDYLVDNGSKLIAFFVKNANSL